jgi:hypothetical protein
MPRQSGTRPRARHCAREGSEAARPGPPFFAANARIAIHGKSALGQKQTFERPSSMSALPPKADILRGGLDVR